MEIAAWTEADEKRYRQELYRAHVWFTNLGKEKKAKEVAG